MIEKIADHLNYANYYQLFRGVFPQMLSMSVIGQDGTILWEAACSQTDAMNKIRAYVIDHPLNSNLVEDGVINQSLPSGETLHLFVLSNKSETSALYIALLMAAVQSPQTLPVISTSDILYTISKNMLNEYELQSALEESESELNAMADELTERYEELNLVYEAENSSLQGLQSQESLRHLVSSCTEFLNVGMTVLVIPDKNITIYDFNDESHIENPVNLIKSIRNDCYYRLCKHQETLVINTLQDAVNYNIVFDIPQKVIITPVITNEDEVIGILVIINNNWKTDFTNSDRNLLHVMSKKVSKVIQTTYDDLTGLVNKHSFEYHLKDALAEVRSKGYTHALLNIDIDRLRVVNDISGPHVGDKLLREIAKTVTGLVRSRDIVARLGGDEFGVLLESCPIDTAVVAAQDICKEIANLAFEWQGEKFDTSACIGVVPITSESESVATILSSSEMARNAAKERGIGQIVTYEQNDIDLLRRRNEIKWVTRIQGAIRDDRFQLYCQLIQSLKPDHDNHYEILIRMIDDDGKLVPPDDFLPAAEHFYLMPEIDRWVIKTTVDYLLDSISNQYGLPKKVALNLSGQSLCDEGFQQYICHHVNRLGDKSHLISFEITESTAIANLELASELIGILKKEGCSFALDDFGTGLSSFAYLQHLDVDYLKIDGSFVHRMVDDPVARTMVSAINQVGQAMGLLTIAEYAENDLIITQLESIGIDFAQGYGFEKPKSFKLLLQEISGHVDSILSAGSGK